MSFSPSIDSLPAMDRSGRAGRTVTSLTERACGALLVTKPVNVRWLTGFTGSNGQLLLTSDGALTLLTDGRYEEQAGLELERAGVVAEVVITRTPEAEVAARHIDGPLAIESHHLTVDDLGQFRSAVHDGVTFVEVGPLIDRLRQPKDVGEQARLAAAAAIADAALVEMEAAIVDGGVTERSLARALENTMFELGADGLSFETIVASGDNSARPHARPSDRVLTEGDLVVIDFGAAVDGYGSDMTRTFVVGAEPSPEQQRLYEAVLRAQTAGKETVVAGVEQVAVDAACRGSLAHEGLADAFVHGTGHGIGLEIHEQPIMSTRSVGILSADLVVTVEPGVYLPGTGGVRIEDSVVVTNDGCETITHFPKGLVPWPLSRPTT